MNMARVGDIATQIRGVTFSKGDSRDSPCEGYLPVVRANNIKDGGLDLSELLYVPVSKIRDNQRVRSNDVLVSTSSGSLSSVGKAAYIADSMDVAWGAFLKVLRPGSKVDGKYFSHFFRTDSYRRNVSALAAGVNINNLKKEHLDNLQMPLPPVDEQRRIAGILDQADAIRTKRRASLALLNELEGSVFFDLMGKPCEVRSLGNCGVDFISGKNVVGEAGDKHVQNRVIKVSSVSRGKFVPSESKVMPASYHPPEAHRINPGDVLFGRASGTLALLGCTVVVHDVPANYFIPDKVWKVKVADSAPVSQTYMHHYLKSSNARQYIELHASGAAGVKNISKKSLFEMPVQFPPFAAQQEFAARVEQINAQRALVERALEKDEELFASLQSRAFSGEL